MERQGTAKAITLQAERRNNASTEWKAFLIIRFHDFIYVLCVLLVKGNHCPLLLEKVHRNGMASWSFFTYLVG